MTVHFIFKRFTTLGLFLGWMFLLFCHARATPQERSNVLMIMVDDLRPALGCYGDALAHTPHIDAFAKSARLFRRAYCQQSVCGPSRTSLLTGKLPDNTGVWHNRNRFRDQHPDLITLPQQFKQSGWHVRALGKIFSGDPRELDPLSWSSPELLRKDDWHNYVLAPNTGRKKKAPLEKADVSDDGYTDGKLATEAILTLKQLKQSKRPFFLAVGFFKPHLPFNAPKAYWDLHDPAKFAFNGNPQRTRGAPAIAYPDHLELGGYQGVPEDENIGPAQAKKLRHGYYACVSYIDAQVGRLLKTLKALDLEDSTLVLLLGDHGFSLGEADHWCKDTNFELDTHAPLIIRVPDMQQPGIPTEALTEYVDLYPTLTDWAGIPQPTLLDGRSLMPSLKNPQVEGRVAALSQFSRPFSKNTPKVMGYSIRTMHHRYTRWIQWENRRVLSEELYDYNHTRSVTQQTPYLIEQKNMIQEASYTELRKALSRQMDEILMSRSDSMK